MDEATTRTLELLCEAIVPGSARVRPAAYVKAVIDAMDPPARTAALAAVDALAPAAPGGAEALAAHAATPAFQQVRALAIEAFYSDFVAPDAPGPGAYAEIGFDASPLAARVKKDWSSLLDGGSAAEPGPSAPRAPRRGPEHFEVVVVGSGAGGGVVAGELARHGRSVLLLETGGHHTAAEFERWESRAMAELWWPMRFAFPRSGAGAPIPMVTGRCVGGTTTINTKVALRASQPELDRWHEATGLVNERGEPFGVADLAPYYERVEQYLGVRERNDWDWRPCVQTVKRGFEALGIDLHPVHAYSDENCMQCGSCLQGCPTNAGKSTLNTYIHREWMRGTLALRADTTVRRVVIEGGEATGVEVRAPDGEVEVIGADAVVVSCGALGSPQLLARSGVENDRIGRNLGFHPAHFVFGLFDEPQDAHMVAPISSHCLDHATVDRGGFVVEAVTVQDPIGFTVALCDEDGPMWGRPLVDAARDYRRWVGLLCMATDDNNGRVITEPDGSARYESDFQPGELARAEAATAFARRALEAAGAQRILWSSPASTHVQGTCPMGADPSRSVVDGNGQSHDVARLYVGDSSLFPRTLSVNPSLTIMALATRLADHLHENAGGQLRGGRELVA